jgi:hypothetical protein
MRCSTGADVDSEHTAVIIDAPLSGALTAPTPASSSFSGPHVTQVLVSALPLPQIA